MSGESYPVPERFRSGIDRALRNIASSSQRWTGVERVELATAARAVSYGEAYEPQVVPQVAADMAGRVATEPHLIDQAAVDQFAEAVGKDLESYVEIVGIVSRITAIDTTHRGIGLALADFPEGDDAPPSGITDPSAKRRSAFVPTVGSAGATTALSSVRSEDAAQEDLHGALYLSYREMGDIQIVKGLPRWQLETVAARTSLINHCLF